METRARVLACVDNRVGFEILRYLAGRPDIDVVGVITHPNDVALCRGEIALLCTRLGLPRFEIDTARRQFDAVIASLEPDFLVSAYFEYILDERFLRLPRRLALNVHPGYLPYNKGVYSYVWAALDGTPAGVSIHVLSPGADGGDVLAQKRVIIEQEDTGESIFAKHELEALRLFEATWPAILRGEVRPQRLRSTGTRHGTQAVRLLTTLDPEERATVRDLIERLRICSFRDRGGCTVELDGQRYRVYLELQPIPAESGDERRRVS